MQTYSDLLGQAIRSMIEVKEEKDLDSLFTGGRTTALVNTICRPGRLRTDRLPRDPGGWMTGSAARPASHPAFVRYPKPQAAFGRTLPKNKIYAHSHANTRLKNLFVQQVEQIVWQFKLAPETINLPARPGVPEIQVFASSSRHRS
jgi:hypothetical protein